MEKYQFLLFLALILLFTKLFGILTAKVHLPQVVGALIAGVILGPSVFGFIDQNDFLIKISEIGVIMLMFLAGIDTDIEELKKTGPAACLIASLGVLVPIIMCGGAYLLFFGHDFKFETMMKAAFIGVVFAATSVSITVETLNEMGKLKSKVGTALLSAAIIDDIIGIVVLSVLSGLGGSSESPLKVIVKILLFFVFTFAVGFIVYNLFKKLSINHSHHRRIAVWALAFCLIMAFCAEKFFGVADITGAYFAGVILCNVTDSRQYVAKKVTAASYLVFSPVFFAGIGLKTELNGITPNIIVFALVLAVILRRRRVCRRRQTDFDSADCAHGTAALFAYAMELMWRGGLPRENGSLLQQDEAVSAWAGKPVDFRSLAWLNAEARYSAHPITETQRARMRYFADDTLQSFRRRLKPWQKLYQKWIQCMY